jgi:hypothetical protein
LGGALGKTLVLAAVTFIAYLIGSFLQINPDGRVAAYLAPEVLFRRRPRLISDTPTGGESRRSSKGQQTRRSSNGRQTTYVFKRGDNLGGLKNGHIQ